MLGVTSEATESGNGFGAQAKNTIPITPTKSG